MNDRLVFPPVRGPRDEGSAAPGDPVTAGDATPTPEAPAGLAGSGDGSAPEPGFKALLRTSSIPARSSEEAEPAAPEPAALEPAAPEPVAPEPAAPEPADDSEPAPAAQEGDAESGHDATAGGLGGLLRRVPWWGWVLAALVIAGAVAAVWLTQGGSGPGATPRGVVVTASAPTPSASPVDRGEGSELHQAIPGTVNQDVLTALTPESAWVADRGAIEAYTAVYTGAADPLSASPAVGTYTVVVGQWATAQEAAAAAEGIADESVGAQAVTGEVTVAGATVGKSWISPEASDSAAASGDATAVWTNGTVVISATGPASDLTRFFDGYGL